MLHSMYSTQSSRLTITKTSGALHIAPNVHRSFGSRSLRLNAAQASKPVASPQNRTPQSLESSGKAEEDTASLEKEMQDILDQLPPDVQFKEFMDELPPNDPIRQTIDKLPPDDPLRRRVDSLYSKQPSDSLMKSQKISTKLVKRARDALGVGKDIEHIDTYSAYGATEDMYKRCAALGSYKIEHNPEKPTPTTESGEELGIAEGPWLHELSLKPTFNVWAQITILHMHLLVTRFRMFPANALSQYQQNLLDHFFFDCERRMTLYHGMVSRMVRQSYLKDVFIQYRGAFAAYDEGLVKNDAVLASAVWRNVFQGAEDTDAVKLAQVVAYQRRTIQELSKIPDGMISKGAVGFNPLERADTVLVQSRGINEPLAILEDKSTGS